MKFYMEFDADLNLQKDENLICDYLIAEKLIKTFNYNNGSNTFLDMQDLKFNLHNCLAVSMNHSKNKIKAEFIPEFID